MKNNGTCIFLLLCQNFNQDYGLKFFRQRSKFWMKIESVFKNARPNFGQNRNLVSIEILVKNKILGNKIQNFGEKIKSLSKLQIFGKKIKIFDQKQKLSSKIKIFDQKQKFSSKIKIFIKNPNFCQKSQFS